MKIRHARFLEFLLIGVLVGVVEDVIAIGFATEAKITPELLIIVFLVAIPFAFLSEIIVDHPRFWERIFKRKKR